MTESGLRRLGPGGTIRLSLMPARPTALFVAASFSLLLVPGLRAQFHNPKTDGAATLNAGAVRAAQMQGAQAGMARAGAARGGGEVIAANGLSGGDMILPPGAREAFRDNNVHLGVMDGKPVSIWGRAIYHSDESFTESKQDAVTSTLTQETKSKNGVTLQRRMITLDAMGRPAEVMIYDGRGQFKYRGVQIYDGLGRFAEEQLYDAKGTLIRRKVQGYDPRGAKMPVRSWDYVANVPPDLKLVITQEDSAAPGNLSGRGTAPTAPAPGAAPGAPGGNNAAPAGEKKGLPRLFGGKKK